MNTQLYNFANLRPIRAKTQFSILHEISISFLVSVFENCSNCISAIRMFIDFVYVPHYFLSYLSLCGTAN